VLILLLQIFIHPFFALPFPLGLGRTRIGTKIESPVVFQSFRFVTAVKFTPYCVCFIKPCIDFSALHFVSREHHPKGLELTLDFLQYIAAYLQ